ncbi:MAG: hypothetical protein KA291_09700, partial [Psychrobacter sp.]|nr:hypothetical protein [Psychrobacter sp.]
MIIQQLTAQRLPKIVATGLLGFSLLSTGLLISGCSDNDNVENSSADKTTDNQSAVDTAKSTDDVEANADVNKTDSIANSDTATNNTATNNTATTDNDIVSHDISPIAAAVK